MKSLLLYGLFSLIGIVVVARVLGKVPEPQSQAIVKGVKAPAVSPTSRPTPSVVAKKIPQVLPTSITQPTTIVAPSIILTPTNRVIECPIEKDGTKMLDLSECNKLIAEHNEALRKRNEEILAENKKILEQYQSDMAAYETKRQELYQECINQPLPNKPARADLPYYGAGYKVPTRDDGPTAAQIIEDCKRFYGYE